MNNLNDHQTSDIVTLIYKGGKRITEKAFGNKDNIDNIEYKDKKAIYTDVKIGNKIGFNILVKMFDIKIFPTYVFKEHVTEDDFSNEASRVENSFASACFVDKNRVPCILDRNEVNRVFIKNVINKNFEGQVASVNLYLHPFINPLTSPWIPPYEIFRLLTTNDFVVSLSKDAQGLDAMAYYALTNICIIPDIY